MNAIYNLKKYRHKKNLTFTQNLQNHHLYSWWQKFIGINYGIDTVYIVGEKNIHRSDVFATLLLVKSHLTFAVEFITLHLSLLTHFCRCARLENETEIKSEKKNTKNKNVFLRIVQSRYVVLYAGCDCFLNFFPFIDNRLVDLGEKNITRQFPFTVGSPIMAARWADGRHPCPSAKH